MNELTRVMQQQASDSKQSFHLWSITNYTKSASAEKQQLQQTYSLNENVHACYAKQF